jgi:hypothetical protein
MPDAAAIRTLREVRADAGSPRRAVSALNTREKRLCPDALRAPRHTRVLSCADSVIKYASRLPAIFH